VATYALQKTGSAEDHRDHRDHRGHRVTDDRGPSENGHPAEASPVLTSPMPPMPPMSLPASQAAPGSWRKRL
jgi:hypothetical protein